MSNRELGPARPGIAPPVLGRFPYWARVLIAHANHAKPFPGFTEEDMMSPGSAARGDAG